MGGKRNRRVQLSRLEQRGEEKIGRDVVQEAEGGGRVEKKSGDNVHGIRTTLISVSGPEKEKRQQRRITGAKRLRAVHRRGDLSRLQRRKEGGKLRHRKPDSPWKQRSSIQVFRQLQGFFTAGHECSTRGVERCLEREKSRIPGGERERKSKPMKNSHPQKSSPAG